MDYEDESDDEYLDESKHQMSIVQMMKQQNQLIIGYTVEYVTIGIYYVFKTVYYINLTV